MMENVGAVAKATAQAIIEQSDRLGLTWTLRPATVITGNEVFLDGDVQSNSVRVVPLAGPLAPAERVMCLLIAETGLIYAFGRLGNLPTPGMMVARIRQETPQTLTTGINAFINLDTVDYDPYGGFDSGLPDRWIFPFAGIFLCNARVVYAANATSRRLCALNLNASTSGTGSIGLQSLQTPATGTCQIGATGVAFVAADEFIGVRALQNSGGNLDTSSSDGGSQLEVIYLGQSIA